MSGSPSDLLRRSMRSVSIGAGTLVVVVDTHKASMVEEPKLLNQTEQIVVVDHHRRGEEFINDAILGVYGALCIIHL